MFTRLKEAATSMTPRELKDLFLDKIKPLSPEIHAYCRGLFKHQEAQQVFTRLRDKQDRDEVISKLLLPARQQYQQAEQRLHYFINNEPPPLNFESDDFKLWKMKREQLQKEVEECRRKCDVEQNVGGVLDTVKSLKDLDDHSETYRLFATSLHYGYFVIIVLGWTLYSIYYFGLYLFDRIPAQRKDVKRSQSKMEAEVNSIGKKVDELQEVILKMAAAAAATSAKETVVKEFADEKKMNSVSQTSSSTQTTDDANCREDNRVTLRKMSTVSSIAEYFDQINPISAVLYVLTMIMMLLFERRMTHLLASVDLSNSRK